MSKIKITKKPKKIRIYGAGGHSQVIREVLEENGYEITETYDDEPSGRHYASKNVASGVRKNLKDFPHEGHPLIIAVGINRERADIVRLLKSDFDKAIHQSAIIAPTAKIGEGTVVFAGAIIQPNTVIGEHVIINTAASIDHDNVIGNFAHISPKAALCGHVEVGEGSHVGVGAVVIPKVKIGKWCTIGAGTVVLKDVPDYSTVVGNPGKIIKTKLSDLKYGSKPKPSEITFVGSGISSSFTILHFLDLIEGHKGKRKINISIIDKYREFHTGIPYGSRSGFSVHLITSLKNFLPEPELGKFIKWLNNNKNWLLDELKKDGGTLSAEWIVKNEDKIKNNEWEDLFIPRRFFGWYINEKVNNKLEEFKSKELVDVNYINAEVIDIKKTEKEYELFLDNEDTIVSEKVIVSVGSLPVNYLWKNQDIIEDDNLLFVNDPYNIELKVALERIDNFLDKNPDKKANVLIVGANASALELLYKLNDIEKIKSGINKFIILSTQGVLPDAVIDEERKREYTPFNLQTLAKEKNITAEIVAEAVFKDLDYADQIHLGAASTVDSISKGFGALLYKLDSEELKKFACRYGNEIGRRQRCAGFHYSKTVDKLKEEKCFDHIAGRFSDVKRTAKGEYSLEYLDTKSGENRIYEDSINIVINCVGSTNLSKQNIPKLLKNLIEKEYCKPNDSKIGFKVNQQLEASDNLHIIGPLLAGNVFEGKAVWHVEHCGRIIWLSQMLSKKMNDYFFKNTELEEKLI
ncbi:sugar O-acyltransferase (sialic acid O-acetyltransferase NeuD family) [Aquimarina sp. MAR_2010_214]|uniref:NeuD/PglB/VioB family sugar acetyltransferase n=1 Tax=Aquimarina sp. MAR_2010_214 TaxID=1250026 RepID=UPI000CAC7B16|nr:NeuD/PglB/VioB family sugar acetyltransferase [Aquimarina sp. MAR_2010_214]PKV50996.1 sugar O-acyltransferase (sialic acid O-acetyltransferase NeuD family) [Aquimarina sp. MAR_2010_214]